MIVKLTTEEASNVRVALISLAKAPNIAETQMAYLLNLSRRFVELPPPLEKKEPVKEGNKD